MFNNHYDVPITTPTQWYQMNLTCLNFVPWRPKKGIYWQAVGQNQTPTVLHCIVFLHKVSICPPCSDYEETIIAVVKCFYWNMCQIALYSKSNHCLRPIGDAVKEKRKVSRPTLSNQDRDLHKEAVPWTQTAGSSCLLLYLAIISACSCGDVEKREGTANGKTDTKLARMSLRAVSMEASSLCAKLG